MLVNGIHSRDWTNRKQCASKLSARAGQPASPSTGARHAHGARSVRSGIDYSKIVGSKEGGEVGTSGDLSRSLDEQRGAQRK